MVVRCKYDAVMPPSEPKGEPDTFINIRALNEWDPKVYLTDTHTLTIFISPRGILVGTMLIGGRTSIVREEQCSLLSSRTTAAR